MIRAYFTLCEVVNPHLSGQKNEQGGRDLFSVYLKKTEPEKLVEIKTYFFNAQLKLEFT